MGPSLNDSPVSPPTRQPQTPLRSDHPHAAQDEKAALYKTQYAHLLGPSVPPDAVQYTLRSGLGGALSSHDLSLMRDLFGMPRRVVSAVHNKKGNFACVVYE